MRGAKTTGVKTTSTAAAAAMTTATTAMDEEGEPEVGGRASASARNYQTTFQAAPAALARL